MKPGLVLSCEHGGHRVPARYRAVLRGAAGVLPTHRGWDPGALTIARNLARDLDAPLVASTTTRLLVDANRSLGHPRLFSEWTRGLPRRERDEIVARWWRPHREAVERLARRHARSAHPVVHVSVHTFAPHWPNDRERRRDVDVGVLYDPSRRRERAFAGAWLRALRGRRSDLRLRRNQPYRGAADGLTTALRDALDERRYLGIELEVSQRFATGPAARWRALRRDVARSLAEALEPDVVRGWVREARAP